MGRLLTDVLCRGLEKNVTVGARHAHGMTSANQTWPHCVNQLEKIHYKPLVAQHGRGNGTDMARYVWSGVKEFPQLVTVFVVFVVIIIIIIIMTNMTTTTTTSTTAPPPPIYNWMWWTTPGLKVYSFTLFGRKRPGMFLKSVIGRILSCYGPSSPFPPEKKMLWDLL